ncbi:MAG: hypothetical protein H6686_05805 [Fibrobacteria bacterium]|nr:hypothetical protein [Fibrobacteria bacterium]
MIDSDLLEILCCPETHQGLEPAGADVVLALNQAIGRSELRDRSGQLVRESIDGALVRKDGQWVYLIRSGIPVLLVDSAVSPIRP